MYNCTVHCTITTRAQLVRRPQRKGISGESEMVTYKHVTEVIRSRCVNNQAKKVDSRTIHLLSTNYVVALISSIFKQTNTNIANQINKLNK